MLTSAAPEPSICREIKHPHGVARVLHTTCNQFEFQLKLCLCNCSGSAEERDIAPASAAPAFPPLSLRLGEGAGGFCPLCPRLACGLSRQAGPQLWSAESPPGRSVAATPREQRGRAGRGLPPAGGAAPAPRPRRDPRARRLARGGSGARVAAGRGRAAGGGEGAAARAGGERGAAPGGAGMDSARGQSSAGQGPADGV